MSEEDDATIRHTISLPASLSERIEDFWHDQRFASRSEAYRVLLERGLEVVEGGKGGGKRRSGSHPQSKVEK